MKRIFIFTSMILLAVCCSQGQTMHRHHMVPKKSNTTDQIAIDIVTSQKILLQISTASDRDRPGLIKLLGITMNNITRNEANVMNENGWKRDSGFHHDQALNEWTQDTPQ